MQNNTITVTVTVKINFIPDTPEHSGFYEGWRAMWDMILTQAKAQDPMPNALLSTHIGKENAHPRAK
jgi:hypothetical protein